MRIFVQIVRAVQIRCLHFFYLCTELKHRFVYGAGIALRDAVEWDMD